MTKPQVDLLVNLRSMVSLNRGFHALQMGSKQALSPLGRVILNALHQQERTQAWLAEELRVSENAVSKWIRKGQISRANSQGLAKALGLTLDDLLSADGKALPGDFDARWRSLPPATKAKIFELIDSLGLDIQRTPPTPPAGHRTKLRKVG